MKNEANICQYYTRQRAISTLLLNACWNQIDVAGVILVNHQLQWTCLTYFNGNLI